MYVVNFGQEDGKNKMTPNLPSAQGNTGKSCFNGSLTLRNQCVRLHFKLTPETSSHSYLCCQLKLNKTEIKSVPCDTIVYYRVL